MLCSVGNKKLVVVVGVAVPRWFCSLLETSQPKTNNDWKATQRAVSPPVVMLNPCKSLLGVTQKHLFLYQIVVSVLHFVLIFMQFLFFFGRGIVKVTWLLHLLLVCINFLHSLLLTEVIVTNVIFSISGILTRLLNFFPLTLSMWLPQQSGTNRFLNLQ